jgi:hypothetical protein
LTEDAYDNDGYEIKISPKEKTRRDIRRLVSANKARIETGDQTVDQLAKQIEGSLLKKGVAYINPITSAASTGYVRQAADAKKAVTNKAAVGGVSMAELRERQAKIAKKRDQEEAREQGISLEEYRENKRKEDEAKMKTAAKAVESLKEQKKSQPALSKDEKKRIFKEKLTARSALDNQIDEKTEDQTILEKDFRKKQEDLDKIKAQLDGGLRPISDEEKDRITNEIRENNEKIEVLTREFEAIEAQDEELKNIIQKIKEADSSELKPGEKAKQREALTARKTVLDGKTTERSKRKSKIKSDIRNLEITIVRNRRQLDSGDKTEELQADLTKLEKELEAARTKISQFAKQIKDLESKKLQILIDEGLSELDIENLTEEHKQEVDDENARASAKYLRDAKAKDERFYGRRGQYIGDDSDSDSDNDFTEEDFN